MSAHEQMPSLPGWMMEAVRASYDRYLVGGIPGHHFMIVRVEGKDDEVRPIGKPASVSRLQSYHFVLRARVLYTLRLLGVDKSRARAIWNDNMQHLVPPRDVNHVKWYIQHYCGSNNQ